MKKNDTQVVEVQAPVMNAETLIAQAIDKKVDVATLEKLLSMRQELKAEQAKEAFDQAMAAFQAECPTIEKKIQGYNYKYADLTSIVEQIKDILAQHGFSYTFDTDEIENKIIVYCKVKHIAGHMEVSKAMISKETTSKMNASQQSGAAMTYGKRYALVNAFGILTGDQDTDAAEQTQQTPSQSAQNIAPRALKASFKQQVYIKGLLAQKGKTMDDLEGYCERNFNLAFEEISAAQASQVIALLQNAQPEINLDEVATGIDKMRMEEK